jgi:hypothetical protein
VILHHKTVVRIEAVIVGRGRGGPGKHDLFALL